jgi:pimeloyl-ACP methyl ester carboxylesterase
MAVATSSGVRLHYVEDGAGDPPVVFIHGWCCDHTFFQPQFDHFKPRHRVLSLDLRGCGESDKPATGYEIPSLTDDVAALCRQTGVERPIVVGHSLGGMIAVELAARHPSIPKAIVAVDPGPLAITAESRAVFEALISALEGPDSDRARRDYVGQMFLPNEDAERRRRITETMCAVPLDIALPVLRGVLTWNGLGALNLVTVPMLVLRCEPGGDNDPSRLSAFKPDITWGITVGAGHFHQLEVPEQVNPMIQRFVSTLR